MIVAITSICLATALLLLSSFAKSLRPANLTTRLSAGASLYKSDAYRASSTLSSFMKTKISEALASSRRGHRVLFELPDFIELLAVAISTGESIYSALRRVVPRLQGILGRELSLTLHSIELGGDLESELVDLSRRLPHRHVNELCSKLNLAVRRGTPLAKVLAEQAESARQEILNQLTKQAGKNETRMLIPLVFLILPVTVLFAIYPSVKLLNIAYL
jgi:tight adherence protein C